MHVLNFGINYKSATLQNRERFAFYKEELPFALGLLSGAGAIQECLIVSTCNRTEIYATTPDVAAALISLRQFFLKVKEIDIDKYQDNFYLHLDAQCLEHLFCVAAGLDSLVLGETQILGQLKEAYLIAQNNFCLSKVLHGALQRAFFVAKKIRSRFCLGQKQMSVGSVALALVKEKFKTLEGKKVLLLGTGETSRLLLEYLQKEKTQLLVANRTYDRALQLAATFGGQAIAFNRVFDYLIDTDILVASTSAPHYLLNENDSLILENRNKPLVILDLAVPRNIDPGLVKIKKINLYNIDDLKSIVQGDLKKRQNELLFCQKIIAQESEKFSRKIFNQSRELVNV